MSRKTGSGAVRRPVLVALGITATGQREVLDFRLAPAESQAAWETFLTDLYQRGFTGAGVELIVTDGGIGLKAALATVFPNLAVQRCWAHIAGRSPRLQRAGMSPLGQIPMSPIAW